MSEKIKEYVESKIKRYTFIAKNFKQEDMNLVDDFCKMNYDNNRKIMILDLIRYKSENIPINLLNDKINFIYNDLLEKIDIKKEKIKEKPKENKWKGFGDKK